MTTIFNRDLAIVIGGEGLCIESSRNRERSKGALGGIATAGVVNERGAINRVPEIAPYPVQANQITRNAYRKKFTVFIYKSLVCAGRARAIRANNPSGVIYSV